MAILTESKVRKLLRTTDLKKTKHLVLEPGTIITPAAKSYLNNVTVSFEENIQKPESPAQKEVVHQPESPSIEHYERVKQPQFLLQWSIHVEEVMSEVLSGQLVSHHFQNDELTIELTLLNTALKDIRNLQLHQDYQKHYQIDSMKYQQELLLKETSYSPLSFLPKYEDGEMAISLYRMYTKVRSLQIHASSCLQPYLLFEDYCRLMDGCRLIADHLWILIIHEVEESMKGRRA